jgi:hypothetical protein
MKRRQQMIPPAALLVLFCLMAGLWVPRPVLAQEEGLTITLRRDFGYASGSGDIQGRFSLRAEGPADLESVTYFIDGDPLGTATEAPFHVQFNTENYPAGPHTITATGRTSGGAELAATPITRNFLAAADARSNTIRLLVYIFGGLALFMGAAYFLINFLTRNAEPLPPGAPREYGYYGGAICPNCQRPYSMHIYGLNLLSHRLDRCDHCGKWRLVRRASPEALKAAERAELGPEGEKPAAPEVDPTEKRHRDLDDSRYQDW